MNVHPSGSIGELCIALAHRWEPERLFMIFTAYFDESGTHGHAPTVVMAAFLGNASQWCQFEDKLSHIQRCYGFTIFHAKDFKAKRGEFTGWNDDRCQRLLGDLTRLVRTTLAEGIVCPLEREPYESAYRAPPIPRKMALDSQYGVCFRACMSMIVMAALQQGVGHRLYIVIEGGHRNVEDCRRIFEELRTTLKWRDVDILGDFTIARKQDKPPLMAADFLASMTYPAIRAAGTEYYEKHTPPPEGEVGLSILRLTPDSLRDMKKRYEAERQYRIEAGRAARKKASSLDEPPS